jgi:hypothetical protein
MKKAEARRMKEMSLGEGEEQAPPRVAPKGKFGLRVTEFIQILEKYTGIEKKLQEKI